MGVNSFLKKNVIQGAAKINNSLWLIVQDPDQSDGKDKLSFSILDNNGVLQESFNLDSSLNLNDMNCPASVVDSAGIRSNVCGTHGQSVYIKNHASGVTSIFLENSTYNGILEFELNGTKSLKYKRKILFTSNGKAVFLSSFAINEVTGKIAILRRYGDSYFVEIFKVPNLNHSIKDDVIDLGPVLSRFQVQDKEIRSGNNQGIALSNDSVYLMTGHLNVNMPKYIFRFPISGSVTPRPWVFRHRIVDQLAETLNSVTAPKIRISYDSEDIEIDCLPHEQETGCEFNYFEPEAIHFDGEKIYYSIVTRPSTKEKLKVMYSIDEQDMKYDDLHLELGIFTNVTREIRKSSALEKCKKTANESKLTLKCRWGEEEIFSRSAIGDYQYSSTNPVLQTFVSDVTEEWAKNDCVARANLISQGEVRCTWATDSKSQVLLDLRPLKIYLDGAQSVERIFKKLTEADARERCYQLHFDQYFDSAIKCLWGSLEVLNNNKLTTRHSVTSGNSQYPTFKCPVNSSIYKIKAACNLENVKIKEDFFSMAKENTLSVYRKAFTRASKCGVGTVEASSSSEILDLTSVLGKKEVSYFCFDKDTRSMGECLIKVDFVCKALQNP